MAVLRGDELNILTYTSRQRFFQRTTGLPWNLTFAIATEKFDDDYCGHSRGPTEDHESFGVERLHPVDTNWRRRPSAATQAEAVKVSYAA